MQSIFFISNFFLLLSCTSTAQLSTPQENVAHADMSDVNQLSNPQEALAPALAPQQDSLLFVTNYEVAKEKAVSMNGEILMVFAGSDWCRPCKQFKMSILNDVDFDQSMKDQLVVLYLDFPAKKANKLPAEQSAHNDALAAKFNPTGIFPQIILMNSAGAPLQVMEFKGQTAADFIAQLNEVPRTSN